MAVVHATQMVDAALAEEPRTLDLEQIAYMRVLLLLVVEVALAEQALVIMVVDLLVEVIQEVLAVGAVLVEVVAKLLEVIRQ